MFDELVQAADEIEGVISLGKLHSNVCLLPSLLVDKKNSEESAGVDATLNDMIVSV
jgi:hypothetical protein